MKKLFLKKSAGINNLLQKMQQPEKFHFVGKYLIIK